MHFYVEHVKSSGSFDKIALLISVNVLMLLGVSLKLAD